MKQLALFRKNIQTLLADTGNGIVTVTHSGFAMVGLAVSVCVVVLALRPDYLAQGEAYVYNWLRERHVSLWWMPDNAVDRVTAADLSVLPKSPMAKASRRLKAWWLSVMTVPCGTV